MKRETVRLILTKDLNIQICPKMVLKILSTCKDDDKENFLSSFSKAVRRIQPFFCVREEQHTPVSGDKIWVFLKDSETKCQSPMENSSL